MEQVLASHSVSIAEPKRSPRAMPAQAGSEAVAVLNHNRPTAYLHPPSPLKVQATFDALLAGVFSESRQ